MITPAQAQEIKEIMENAGIPIHVWLPIMHLESGGNPQAHNPRGEDSRGLFQINVETAPADIVHEFDLFNPIENARAILAQDWLGNVRRLLNMQQIPDQGAQAAYMWRHGIRPRWSAEHDQRIRHWATAGLPELKAKYGLTTHLPAENVLPHEAEAEKDILVHYGLRDFRIRPGTFVYEQERRMEETREAVRRAIEGGAFPWYLRLAIGVGAAIFLILAVFLLLKDTAVSEAVPSLRKILGGKGEE